MLFLKTCQNPQEDICARVSFLIKLWKGDSDTDVFIWILRNFWKHFFYRAPFGDSFLVFLWTWEGDFHMTFQILGIIFQKAKKNGLAFMCIAILRWAAPRLQFTFLGSYVCIGSRKISPREIPTRKILTHQAPPPPWKITSRKILTQKISTWNIPTYFIICLASLNTTSINGRRVYMYILPEQNI